ncbi:hypothetical protein RND71_008101 [Anisodus tanguticus]|uniref:Uncharacterized protein n=1 Tax=Anisodus tanguticus TaxID=243964 RepID=A0AAE1SMT4_9SOLA|nr:hypothetical protein RND71_008101 [Anisodus tanguticus]
MHDIIILVQHNGSWDSNKKYVDYDVDAILIKISSTFNELVAQIATQFQHDSATTRLEIKYTLREGFPPMNIFNDMGVKVYFDLNKKNTAITSSSVASHGCRGQNVAMKKHLPYEAPPHFRGAKGGLIHDGPMMRRCRDPLFIRGHQSRRVPRPECRSEKMFCLMRHHRVTGMPRVASSAMGPRCKGVAAHYFSGSEFYTFSTSDENQVLYIITMRDQGGSVSK